MTAQTNFQTQGQNLSAGETRALFLDLFGGDVLAAFKRTTVTEGRHRIQNVGKGRSFRFPTIGRAKAQYLSAGNDLDDQRVKIEHSERVIPIDEILASEVLITDIYEALNHFEVRSEYADQLGEAIALANDGAVLANIFNAFNVPENIPTNMGVEGTGKTSNIDIGLSIADISEANGKALYQALGEAKVHLDRRHVPLSQRYFMTTPEAYASLVMAMMPFGANFQIMVNQSTGSLVSRFHEFEVVAVPHLLIGGANGKHQVASNVMASNPIGAAYHYSAVATVRNKPISLEMARRTSLLSNQVVAYSLVGHGVLRPESVVVISEDAIV